jgi:hypothetical protein
MKRAFPYLIPFFVLLSPFTLPAQDDTFLYKGDLYDPHREISYWGVVQMFLEDYRVGHLGGRSADARALGLLSNQEINYRFPVREDLQAHFMDEFRRTFQDLPYHDVREGRSDRRRQFTSQYPVSSGMVGFAEMDAREKKWDSYEAAALRALHGGRGGAVLCGVWVKRREFPVLYEISCGVSPDVAALIYPERHYAYGRGRVGDFSDIGFSTPDHIAGEIKVAASEMLKRLRDQMEKIRKAGQP